MKMPAAIRQRVIPAAAATGVVALLAGVGWYGYSAVANRPVRHVVFTGDVDRLPRDVLEEFSRELQKRPVGTSLVSVRENAKRIPWVRDASARRDFPDTIEVRFEAYRPLARWNDKDLVSVQGEIFSAPRDTALPLFRGPEGFALAMVTAWPRLVESLAPVGSPLAELHVSARGAWEVVLASGLRIVLGREDMVARAQRFAQAWPQVVARGVETRYADLRYPNGFALRQAAQVTAPKNKK